MKRLLKMLLKDVVKDAILPHDMATKSDERCNGNGNGNGNGHGHPLMVPSKSMPKVDFRERDEHPQHHDLAEILSKSLEKLSELQGIVDEHATWHVEVEKDISQWKLHDTQMACVVEKLSQKISKQDNIIETLRERLDKKETSTQQVGIHKRSIESIYFSESPVKPGAVQMNEKVSMQMNLDVSVKMNEAIGTVRRLFEIVICIDGAFADRAAFSTLKPGGLLDDMVLIPVNRNGNHWFLVEVDLLRRKVIILDSMLPRRIIVGPEMCTLMAGLEYVIEGKQQEDGFAYNFTEWFCKFETSIPQQENYTDCGIFMIGYIEYWNGEPGSIPFTQDDIEAYRNKIAKSLLLSPLNLTGIR
ncbi:hypothetical protein HHK36_028457 [Tetracentron sinense]|uniref:Ubiquitin-like protease family profile domain-containing protein n=1 Tax=Tetracentron sinense TaxID=13715 RepID=A0A835D0L5_TETSI|nr:hypothetical protein HHK36_028457 [Tetracentron sinense]